MFARLTIPDIILVEPRRHSDERGWFMETYRASDFRAGGIAAEFIQDNESMSHAAGTVRGLHFQAPPSAQAKLIRCTAGAVLDVAVDIRRNSPTFGRHVGAELSSANGRQIYVPVGFAHGYCTLTADTVVEYKVSSPYDPASERGIAWNDPDLAIPWPATGGSKVLSPRDSGLPRLATLPDYF
jgi:dTDP-4-dehydrorhamnose 3,5-epimerase